MLLQLELEYAIYPSNACLNIDIQQVIRVIFSK